MKKLVNWWAVACVLLVSGVTVGATGAGGAVSAVSGGYVAVSPTRIVDTRVGERIDDDGPDLKGRPVDGSVLRVPVVGRAGVSGDVAGVVLNVTVAGASGLGHVSVFACDTAVPSTSSVNFRPGVAVANLVMSRLGAKGDVCVLVRGSADVVIDVAGFVPAAGSPRLLDPTRIVDTRVGERIDDDGPDLKGRPVDGSVLRVPVVGRAGVSGDVAGVVLNVTVAGASGLGHVSVFACDTAVPSTSSVNFRPGVAVANLVMSRLGAKGDVCVLVRGSADVVIDVAGFVPVAGSPRLLDPTRIADTRVGERIDDDGPDVKGRRGDGSVLRVPVAGRAGIAAGDQDVVLNVTAAGATGRGHVSVFACDTPVPSTSNVNFGSGAAVANLVVSRLGVDGDVCLFVRGSTELVVDVVGAVSSSTEVNPPTTSTTSSPTNSTGSTPRTTTTSTTGPTTSSSTSTSSSTTSSTSTSSSTTSTTNAPIPPVDGDAFKRTFVVPPGGTVDLHTELYETALSSASRLEPVGLYLDEGDVVFIELSGGVNVDAQVGMDGDLDELFQRVPLGNGLNQVVATHEGPLFLSNLSTDHTATATVYAAPEIKRIPTFRLGESTDAGFAAEVAKATDVPKIFLIGKYFMTYVHRDTYLGENPLHFHTPIVKSPTKWLQKRDREMRMYHEFVGRTESVDRSNANSYPVTREYISTANYGYMDARDGFVSINGTSAGLMARIFEMDEVDSGRGASWASGPLHELGHHQQQALMAFPNAGEAAPNIYKGLVNLHLGLDYGFGIGADHGPDALYGLAKPPADATGAKFQYMVYLYMQLFAAFGEGFYSQLHHEYRLLDHQTKARTVDWDEMSLFAYLTSKVSGYDLRPFFASWRLPIDAEYTAKIDALGLPTPTTDLSARKLTDIKSPADLEGRYQAEIEPYTNLPVANAKSDFVVPYGTQLSPFSLVSYDPAVVKSVEFLNPNEQPTQPSKSDYGPTLVELLLTGHDGQRNVVVASGMVAPPSWGADVSPDAIYNRVAAYVASAEFQSGTIDPAVAQVHLDMIHAIDHADTADLIRQLNDGIIAVKAAAHGDPFHDAYFYSLSDADTLLYDNGVYNDRPAVRIDAQQWNDIRNSTQFVIRAYESKADGDPSRERDRLLGHIRNGKVYPDGRSLNILKFDVVGDDVIVYVDAPFGTQIPVPNAADRPINKITFRLYHQDLDVVWKEVPVVAEADRIGLTTRVTGHWVDAQFRRDMTGLEPGSVGDDLVFRLAEHAWNTIDRAGSVSLAVYRDGVQVGTFDGTNSSGLVVDTADAVMTIRVPNVSVVDGTVYELKGNFVSDTSADLDGRIYLKLTANMLSSTFPVRLS